LTFHELYNEPTPLATNSMSFGFGPGDIVSVLAFGKKVVDALQEEDGSSAQYRVAKQQCDAFVALMDSVQSLDLSHLPEDFRTQIKVYSKDVEEHLEWFKRCTMDKYDKSMGKNATRNRFTSSPRKVQWALYAADDLAKFSTTLNNWLQLINTYMQFRFL
jgi:hypothetical protein